MSRYLWAVGESAATYNAGDVLADRYLCKGPRIFLDTKPALLPDNLDEVPELCIPYLKLSPHQLHIPQVHDWIQFASGEPKSTLLLLDQAPLCEPKVLAGRGIVLADQTEQRAEEVQLLPRLKDQWQTAPALRQLNWLWQLANLWYPMSVEGVVSSLLNSELLRVEGAILRLRELQFDSRTVSLAALGDFLLALVKTAQPEIQAPLQQLAQDLSKGGIRSAEALVEQIDDSIASLGRSQQTCEIHVATLSDQGPSRPRNEDACYPKSGTNKTVPPAEPLVIVCDGIGGHQGGDVASNLAIKTLEQQVKTLEPDKLSAAALEVELEKAVGVANDLISQQNDQEQRFDRQRMGTTVVMALVRSHELYITHIGDSRAYWITQWGCHQVTQDDDVASREVRLGYSSYPQALQQPSAGSLVQALGMGSATNLYPTVQRFILDDDGVFLLCSDGLSDNDQVEKNWDRVILPLLNGQADLSTVSQQLINIANTHNGYDNSTIGIIHCKVTRAKAHSTQTVTQTKTVIPSASQTRAVAPVTAGTRATDSSPLQSESPTLTSVPTQQLDPPSRSTPSKSSGSVPLVAAILALSALAAGIVAAVVWFRSLPVNTSQANPTNPSSPAPSPTNPPASAGGQTVPSPELGISPEPLQVNTDILVASNLAQYNQQPLVRRIPTGSVVHETARKSFEGELWVQLKVCAVAPDASVTEVLPETPAPDSTPSESAVPNDYSGVQKETASAGPKDLTLGEAGWISGDRYRAARATNNLTNAAAPLNPNCPSVAENPPGNEPEAPAGAEVAPNLTPETDPAELNLGEGPETPGQDSAPSAPLP